MRRKAIIVGGGFGGLEAAKALGGENVDVTLIDRTNYHLFQPLLYQVATAALSPADIAAPVRAVLDKCRNMEVILAEVIGVDVAAREVKTHERVFPYDYLILATGSRHSYFGHEEWEKLAPGLKSLEDAIEIRRRILMAFEFAEKIEDEAAHLAQGPAGRAHGWRPDTNTRAAGPAAERGPAVGKILDASAIALDLTEP